MSNPADHSSSERQLRERISEILVKWHMPTRQAAISEIMAAGASQTEQLEIKAEIKGKLAALNKLIMGAGEYHDDPYEYVIRLSDARNYRLELSKFDLEEPIYRDKAALTTEQKGDGK